MMVVKCTNKQKPVSKMVLTLNLFKKLKIIILIKSSALDNILSSLNFIRDKFALVLKITE